MKLSLTVITAVVGSTLAAGKKGGKMSMMGGKKAMSMPEEECVEPPTSTPVPACDEGATVLDATTFCDMPTVTPNTLLVLNEDIECSSVINNAIGHVLAGDGTVLDCRGNSISYTGTDIPNGIVSGTGLFAAASNVVIKNCMLSGFRNGIAATVTEGAWDNLLVKDVTATGNIETGIFLEGSGSETAQIFSSSFNGNGDGIFVDDAAVTVVDSTTNDNTKTPLGYGILVGDDGSLKALGHTATGNDIGIGPGAMDSSVDVTASFLCDNESADILQTDLEKSFMLTAVTCDRNTNCDCPCPP